MFSTGHYSATVQNFLNSLLEADEWCVVKVPNHHTLVGAKDEHDDTFYQVLPVSRPELSEEQVL